MNSPRLLQVSHEKELLIEKLKYETSLGRRRKRQRLGKVHLVFAPGAPRSRCSVFTQLLMKMATLWKMKTNRAGDSVNIWGTILKRVSKARGTIAMKVRCGMFRRLLTTYVGTSTEMNLMNSWPQKKESAPGPDGIPKKFYRCAGGLGSQFLHIAYKHVIESGSVPALFAASRTVFIPKSSDVDNNGRIVRSPGKHYAH